MMNTGVRKTVILCVLFVSAVMVLSGINKTRRALPDLEQFKQRGLVVLQKPREIKQFSLLNQDNEPFGQEDLRGKWSVMFFGFTRCPDICPTAMATMAQTLHELAEKNVPKEVSFYLVSVDPERDTVQRLKEYVSYFSPKFSGVTGTREELSEFALQVGVAFAKVPFDNSDGYTIDHSGQLIVFNPRGHFHAFIKMPYNSGDIALFLEAVAREFKRFS